MHTSSCSDYQSANDVEDAVEEGDDVDSSEMVRICLEELIWYTLWLCTSIPDGKQSLQYKRIECAVGRFKLRDCACLVSDAEWRDVGELSTF